MVTNENVTDTIQAEAAGMAEGALTWKFLAEYYKEFYVNDVCKSEPGACEWISGQIRKNAEYVRRTVVATRAPGSQFNRIIENIFEILVIENLIEKYFQKYFQ